MPDQVKAHQDDPLAGLWHSELSPFRFNIGALLRDPHDALDRRLQEKLDARGYGHLRRNHGLVFQFIGAGTTTVELAHRAQMTKQAMAEIVAYLEEHGYVERVPHPSDGRAKLVRLTPKGAAMQPTALRGILEIEREWKALLGEARFEKLRRALIELREALERNPGDTPG